jgi:hypothetical protein
MNWLDRLPTSLLLVAALFLGLAPFIPEPHVVEKLRLLISGSLRRPLDIFDLCFHLLPLVLLLLKLGRTAARKHRP